MPEFRNVRGNPRYLVNIIQLPPEKEYLRNKVFRLIFRESILFERFDHAVGYRKKTKDSSANLYSLDGLRILSNGLYDPARNKLPKDLKDIFGALPPSQHDLLHLQEGELVLLFNIKL